MISLVYPSIKSNCHWTVQSKQNITVFCEPKAKAGRERMCEMVSGDTALQ